MEGIYKFYDENGNILLTYKVEPPKQMLEEFDYIKLEEGEVPEEKEIAGKKSILKINVATKELYYEYVDTLTSKEKTLEEKIQTLTENLAKEKINNMKKDSLATKLTKELANLKIEVMKLKKGGNQ